jgi:hypothetical protein
MGDLKQLYDEDIVAWSEQQAETLRAAGRSGSNLNLDWENLAEEIDDLGKSYRASLKSHIRRIVEHLVKLQYSPAIDPRHGWRRTVALARLEIGDLLEHSPSLRRTVGQVVESVTKSGVELAIADLADRGEVFALGARIVRRVTYTPEQILGDWFPPEPQG